MMRFMMLASEISGAEGAQMNPTVALLIQIVPFVLIALVFYFLMIRPQRKRDKETQKMRNSLEVGDEIVTSGGIIGRVVSIREDTVVIETGSDRSKVRIMRWAIQANNTIHDN